MITNVVRGALGLWSFAVLMCGGLVTLAATIICLPTHDYLMALGALVGLGGITIACYIFPRRLFIRLLNWLNPRKNQVIHYQMDDGSILTEEIRR